MSSLFSHIVCLSCGHEMPASPLTVSCAACGGTWLDAQYSYSQLQWGAPLDKRDTSLWRYAELLPVLDASPRVSMGEGWTPLYRADRLSDVLGHANLFIKDERQGPTGTFKDRQGAESVA